MKNIITYCLLILNTAVFAQTEVVVDKTKIEILSANELVYNQEVGRYQICRGNVKFKQGAVYMDCDSARFYEEVNKIEAFGNIYIRQKDTIDLWGDYLEYDGDLRLAKVSENVRLTDGEMTLTTDQINYDLEDKIGYYTTGGHIDNGSDKLYSKRGTYYSRSKEFHFKDSVKLTNEDYVMTSDTLNYNTYTKVAYFHGPTYIESEENTIYCQYGWYNTEEDKSQFSKGAYIQGKENKLDADSMVYDRITGYGEAFGNIRFVDTTEEITITGNYGNYNRLDKTTLITQNPIAIKNMDGDSIFFKADTLIDVADTSSSRTLTAYRNVKVFKSDLQAVSDSLVYNFTDSTIWMFTDPILWTDSNQITGDTIVIYRGSEGLEKLRAYNNGFVAEKDPNGFFNQISGKTLDAFFTNGNLKKIKVNGNGQSIYYAKEDSLKYSGVQEVICGKMTINIDSATRIRNVIYYNSPKAIFYPLEHFPSNKSRLQGLNWRTALRPRIAIYLN